VSTSVVPAYAPTVAYNHATGSWEIADPVNTSVKIKYTRSTDLLQLVTQGGANASLDGSNDTISLATVSGGSVVIDEEASITAAIASTSFALTPGAIALTADSVKVGNATSGFNLRPYSESTTAVNASAAMANVVTVDLSDSGVLTAIGAVSPCIIEVGYQLTGKGTTGGHTTERFDRRGSFRVKLDGSSIVLLDDPETDATDSFDVHSEIAGFDTEITATSDTLQFRAAGGSATATDLKIKLWFESTNL